jgi:radical SAM protein with 4Fe4S-binding SPASM domain
LSRQERQFRYIQLELTDACNHRCSFCYNVWKEDGAYPEGHLGPDETIALVDRIIDQTHCEYVSLTGGEPLLRKDVYAVIERIASRDVKVILITNGNLLTEETVRRCLDAGLTSFEVSLHSCDAGAHDELTGTPGSFEKAVGGLTDVANAGGHAATVFVATSRNVGDLPKTLELNALLRSKFLLFNRVACGGQGLAEWDTISPSPALARGALMKSIPVAEKYGIGLGVGVQMPPCLMSRSGMEAIAFKFCPLNDPIKDHTYLAVDPRGNLRMCNRSRIILGNVLDDVPIPRLMESDAVRRFSTSIPSFCRGCKYERECAGGCRADSHSRWGVFDRPDPWIERWLEQVVKPGADGSGQPA